MRTTLNLDEAILDEIMALTGKTNRSEAVRQVLQDYVGQQRKQRLLAMRGKVKLEGNWELLRDLESSSK